MENRYIEIAKEVGASYAKKLYADFTKHPEYLGENFSWDKFHVLCGRLASTGLYTHFSNTEWSKLDTHRLEDMCREAAEKKAKEIISASSSAGIRA